MGRLRGVIGVFPFVHYLTGVSTSAFLEVKQIDRGAVARITCPAVGQREAPIVEEELKTAAGGANNRLIIDMSSVTVLGSMGLGMLVTITKRCRDGGGRLAIIGLSPALLDLIRLTKLDKFLVIAKDEVAAIEKLAS
jgi:anti-sigma B factor antagonist